MIGTIARVVRGEGPLSALRRASERIGEAARSAALRARGAFVAPGRSAVLNVSFAPVWARLGGVPAQLAARLHAERTLRDVALLHPGGLETFTPFPSARRLAGDPEAALRRALEITGARSVHLEGTLGVPLASVLRLAESGVRVVLGVHDFSLFCASPHLFERGTGRFCDYSRDRDRCGRCHGDQSERRALGGRLLAAAAGVIFPSRFLLERHRELFSLPGLAGEVVEPGVPAPDARAAAVRPAVAYAGSVKRHKGAHLLPEIVRRAGAGAEWHVFGGGDEDLLRALRLLPNATVHGYHRHGRLPALLARHGIGLVVLPSIVPESYSLVLSEAWLAGAAVAAFDLGAPAERIRRDGGGFLAPLESGAEGLGALVERWRSGALAAAAPRAVPAPLDAARATVALYRRWGLLP